MKNIFETPIKESRYDVPNSVTLEREKNHDILRKRLFELKRK